MAIKISAKYIFLIFLILVCGIFLRTVHIKDIFSPYGVEYIGTDSYYHAHQTVNIDKSFPKVPLRDSHINFPEGQRGFPGGFAFVSALFAKLLGLSGEIESIRILCAIMPLFWFLLASAVIFVVSGRSFFLEPGENARAKALTAVALFAVLPQSVFTTSLGNYDHHIVETVFFILSLYAALDLSRRASVKRALLYGMMFGLMPFFWAQSALFLFLFGFAGALSAKRLFAFSALISTLVFVLLVFLLGDIKSYNPNIISWGQVIAGAATVLAVFLGIALRKKPYAVTAAAAFSIFALICAFTDFKYHAADFIKVAVNSLIMPDARPNESFAMSRPDFMDLHTDYSLLIIVILLIPAALFFSRQRRHLAESAGFSILYLFFALALMSLQIRFQTLLTAVYVLLASELIIFAWSHMGKWIIKQNIRVAAYIALVAVFMPVSAFDFSPISNSKVHGGFAAFRNACLFLKQQSEGQDRSQIGVLTKWDYGHWVIHYCGMPTVTSPLSNPYERSSKILYMSDMEEARAVLASKRVKYVISVLPSEDFQPLSSGLGIETEYMYFDGGSWFYKKEIFDTLNGRLSFLRYDLLPDWLKITYVSGASVDISGTKLPLIVVAQID